MSGPTNLRVQGQGLAMNAGGIADGERGIHGHSRRGPGQDNSQSINDYDGSGGMSLSEALRARNPPNAFAAPQVLIDAVNSRINILSVEFTLRLEVTNNFLHEAPVTQERMIELVGLAEIAYHAIRMRGAPTQATMPDAQPVNMLTNTYQFPPGAAPNMNSAPHAVPNGHTVHANIPRSPFPIHRVADPNAAVYKDKVSIPGLLFTHDTNDAVPVLEIPYERLLLGQFYDVEQLVSTLSSTPIRLTFDDPHIGRIVQEAKEHVGNSRVATSMLTDTRLCMFLVGGMLNRALAREIYDNPILNSFPHEIAEQYDIAWKEERRAAGIRHGPENFPMRLVLAQTRAHFARIIVQLNGFWTWVESRCDNIVQVLLEEFVVFFPINALPQAYAALFKIVNSAMKMTLRMLAEKGHFYQFNFYENASPWFHERYIQRNPELAGQDCAEMPPRYLVQCTITPEVHEKDFGMNVSTNIHKAEVLLSYLKRGDR